MIFGALVDFERASTRRRAPATAWPAPGRDRPSSPATAATTPAAPICGDERHREAEMEARASRAWRRRRRQVGMHRERRLHIGEGRDDDAPDALGGVERQDAVMALDQPAHHVGLARRAGRPSRSPAVLLDRDQAVDDLAALHQQAVHLSSMRSISARRSARAVAASAWSACPGRSWRGVVRGRSLIGGRPPKAKKTLTLTRL